MMKLFIYLCCYLFVNFAINESEARLKLVNIVFRHGDRTPSKGDEGFPKDPYNNDTFYPIGRGGLTNKGKRREFELGKILRERYNDLLGDIYDSHVLKARTTDYDRTKMSLQLVLASLFPPKGVQIWDNNLDWQPIPYSYFSSELDTLLIPEECPQYANELRKILISLETKNKMTKYLGFMQILTDFTGKTINNAFDMYNLYLGLVSEAAMNLTLPEWTNKIDFPGGKLLEGTLLYYNTFSQTAKLRRLNGGMLVKQIFENINKSQNSTKGSETKMYLYSGHETNIAALLQALKVYKPHVPAFSSAIIVELLENEFTNKSYIQVLYYTGIPSTLTVLKLPGCSEICPLESAQEILSDSIPSKEDQECDKVGRPEELKKIYDHYGMYLTSTPSVVTKV